ncbi:Amino Acid/Auxin Permease (AAAP) Family, partial [Pseudoloma neurophilia]
SEGNQRELNQRNSNNEYDRWYSKLLTLDALKGIGTFVFAFTCHQNLITVQNELLDNHPNNMKKIIFSTSIISLIIYLIFGYTNYIIFYNRIYDNILKSYPLNNLTIFLHFLYVIVMGFSYPLQINPARVYFMNLFGVYDNEEVSSETVQSNQESGHLQSNQGSQNDVQSNQESGHLQSNQGSQNDVQSNQESGHLQPKNQESGHLEPKTQIPDKRSETVQSKNQKSDNLQSKNKIPDKRSETSEVIKSKDHDIKTTCLAVPADSKNNDRGVIHIIFTFILLLTTYGLTITGLNLGEIYSFIGSTASTMICLIFPILIYYYMYIAKRKILLVGGAICFIIGCAVFVLSLFRLILNVDGK